MNIIVPTTLISFKQRITLALFLFLCICSVKSQSFKGRDGAKSYTTAGTYILNRYSALAASVSAGAASLTVSNITELSGSYSFTNAANPYANDALSQGDLVMIMQMQGADI
ncbi:MAG: hypothetical protein ABUT20_30860, partial [Bacteroidota bacterium]